LNYQTKETFKKAISSNVAYLDHLIHLVTGERVKRDAEDTKKVFSLNKKMLDVQPREKKLETCLKSILS
jgi:hypothetical protein